MDSDKRAIILILLVLSLEFLLLLAFPMTHHVTVHENNVILDGEPAKLIHFNGSKYVKLSCCLGLLPEAVSLPNNNESSKYVIRDYVCPGFIAMIVFTVIYLVLLMVLVKGKSRMMEFISVLPLLHFLIIILVLKTRGIEVIPLTP